jgi:hypothetical protein
MACLLSVPQWDNQNQVGIKAAVENIADNTVVVTWHPAHSTSPATTMYYLIYTSPSIDNLFAYPKFISTANSVAIPMTLVSPTDQFAVRAAQIGLADTFPSTGLELISDNLYAYPQPANLTAVFAPADGYLFVDSVAGYPTTDGYLMVGTEITKYDFALSSYLGSPAFHLETRDPFGCNDAYGGSYPIGTDVALFKGFEAKQGTRIRGLASCGLPLPTWVDRDYPGVKTVKDLGIGKSVLVSWGDAKAPPGFSNLIYNVYVGNSIYTLLDSNPYGFTTNLSATVPGLHPGDGYLFAVRASYGFATTDPTLMTEVSSQFYSYPTPVLVNENDGYYQTNQTGALTVTSTSGFPSAGFIRIGSEVMQYSGITGTTFQVSRRDVFAMNKVSIPNGTKVYLFKGVEEGNTSIYMATPSWVVAEPWLPLVPGDGYDGYQYMQGTDGYRTHQVDIITEDHSETEATKSDFLSEDYCGVRSQNFVDLYTRNQCGTYFGGRINGYGGGIDVFTANAQRQEMLLGLTGEPFVLLRRKWTGRGCYKQSIHSEHPHARCSVCYGTMFAGGFDRYDNARTLRPAEPNPNGFISCRVSPYTDDLGLFENRGLSSEVVEMEVWTMAIPTIKDRDILIRYVNDIETGFLQEEFRYEVLSVTRNKLLFGADGNQKIKLRRLNRTEEIYKFPVTLV